MTHTTGLLEVFIFLAAACLAVLVASRFKLGSVLGYLLAGIVIGPYVLGFITDAEQVMHFAEFGVVMMMFLIGLELEPSALWRLRKSILGMGGLQVVLTTAVFCAVGMAIGYSWQISLAAGMALSLSSTALVLQMLHEKNLMNSTVGETSFSTLLFQDIAVIPILVLMPLLATASTVDSHHGHDGWIHHLPAVAHVALVAAVIAAMIAAGRYGLPHLFRMVARTNLREIFTALSLALIIGITLLMQVLGVSAALGAFIAGVVLAGSEYRRTLETDIEPFKGLLLGLFFISVGMGMDFGLIFANPIAVAGAVVALIVIKAVILLALGRAFGMVSMHAIGYALALAQGGEFAFVLFQFAGGLSILSEDQRQFLTVVVAISIALTPLLMLWYSRVIVPRFMSSLPQRDFDVVDDKQAIILAGFGRFGQVIGRFLTGQGMNLTVLEKDPDQIALLRKFGFKGYFGDATRLDLLKTAGALHAKLLIIAVDDVDTCLEIARMAKEEFPTLSVFARARNRRHAYELHKIGVSYFKRELFDSSLDMAKEILMWLGTGEKEAASKAEQFRYHDEETLKASFEFFNDEPALIRFSKTRREELATILQSDHAQNHYRNKAL